MRRLLLIAAIAAALVVVLGAVALVLFRAGAPTPGGAALARARAAACRQARVLEERRWGRGELVLTGCTKRGQRHLGIAFVDRSFRGWHASSYTDGVALRNDVVVGSLVLANSEGGQGEPAFSAAAGELADARVARVEVTWTSGGATVAPRHGDAYFAVRRGVATARLARFLASNGAEIARVPLD